MPIKKFKANVQNTGPGDVLIQSSTSHYTSRGLVQKTKVSKQPPANSTPTTSPSKSPQKITHGLTPCHEQVQGFDFDGAMLEPLRLPQSKAREYYYHSPISANNYSCLPSHKMITSGSILLNGNSTSPESSLPRLGPLNGIVAPVVWQRRGGVRIVWAVPSSALHAVAPPIHPALSIKSNIAQGNFMRMLG